MTDTQNLFYAPRWVKAGMLFLLIALLSVSSFLLFKWTILGDKVDHVLTALSVSQIAVIGLGVLLMSLFGRTNSGYKELEKVQKSILEQIIPEKLSVIQYGEKTSGSYKASEVSVETLPILSDKNIISQTRRKYYVKINSDVIVMNISINVKRIFVLYFFPLDNDNQDSDEVIKEHYKNELFPTGSSKKAGWEVYASVQDVQDRFCLDRPSKAVIIHCETDWCEDLLSDAKDRLYWSQDIGLMTEAIYRTAKNKGIDIDGKEYITPTN